MEDAREQYLWNKANNITDPIIQSLELPPIYDAEDNKHKVDL
jgi:hypothetical protein